LYEPEGVNKMKNETKIIIDINDDKIKFKETLIIIDKLINLLQHSGNNIMIVNKNNNENKFYITQEFTTNDEQPYRIEVIYDLIKNESLMKEIKN
jgi:hypothetical protein